MSGAYSKEDIRACLYLGLFLALCAFVFGYRMSAKHSEPTEHVRTDTLVVERWDTVIIEKPTEIARNVVRHGTLRKKDFINVTDSALLKNLDSLNLTIPIEQAVYSDSTENADYTAYISGFHAALDSINIFCKNTETIITNEVRLPSPRFSVGVQAGVGVSLQGLAVPYLGVGVQYRLFGK